MIIFVSKEGSGLSNRIFDFIDSSKAFDDGIEQFDKTEMCRKIIKMTKRPSVSEFLDQD